MKELLEPDQPLVKERNKSVSFLGFIFNEINIYAITGGIQSYFAIQNYIDQDFGIGIISRLISRNDKVIREVKERGLVGSLLGSIKYFRENYTLADEDEFGNFYKQLKADLPKDLLISEFGFLKDSLREKTGCIAKSSFQINKSVDLNQLLKLITKIENIWARKPKYSVNKVYQLNRKIDKDRNLIIELDNTLLRTLYGQVVRGNINLLDFDLCNKDFEKYLSASCFKVYKNYSNTCEYECEELNDPIYLFQQLNEQKLFSENSEADFSDSIKSIYIESYNANGEIATKKSPLLEHLHGEIEFQGVPYFYVDGNWYEIKQEFLKELKEDCLEIINNSNILQNDILKYRYAQSKDEEDYIKKYIKEQNYLVLHKVKHENIELCDLLKYTDKEIYLIHIKKGFTNSIRDLSSQVLLSARRIYEDLKSTPRHTFLKGMYRALQQCKDSDKQYFKDIYKHIPKSERAFLSLFDKTIYNCFAFVDISSKPRDIRQIDKFNSNIAKCSLVILKRSMRSRDWNFKIIQIRN